ncbi:MAG: hypothetical protein M1818_004222 [Claussenomyces sp. TS43310]|nr:MAG: hypothetical protein M1818_004222 [Claussenomyces sp. TS43310]
MPSFMGQAHADSPQFSRPPSVAELLTASSTPPRQSSARSSLNLDRNGWKRSVGDTTKDSVHSSTGMNGFPTLHGSHRAENAAHDEYIKSHDRESKIGKDNITDFFSRDVFQFVLNDPRAAHNMLRYCHGTACDENMRFLEKMKRYHLLLDNIAKDLGEIQQTYISVESSEQINISQEIMKGVTIDVGNATQSTIPTLAKIFSAAKEDVEELLWSDTYPRFVKHQMTLASTLAIAEDKTRYAGLGDSFCLTDHSIVDDPITFASDGFVEVTGYTRHDIIPRNCRFLQGPSTDKGAVKRLRLAINSAQESVELLLNYRKNGDPFWNLLYVAPLFDGDGNLAFFLGAQINCSTAIHSATDVIDILSLSDDDLEEGHSLNTGISKVTSAPISSTGSRPPSPKKSSSLFKNWRKHDQNDSPKNISVRSEAGMEGELIGKIRKLSVHTQAQAFYNAYSKYFILRCSPLSSDLNVKYFSKGVIELLGLKDPREIMQIRSKEIFKILSGSSGSTSSSFIKDLKNKVRDNVRAGKAVSVDIATLTGPDGNIALGWKPQNEKVAGEAFTGHWTPLKDGEGKVGWVVLTIVPR